MKILFVLFSIFLLSCSSNKKKISLSFDDAPRGNSWKYKGIGRTEKLINELNKSQVKRAAFYIQTNQIKSYEEIYRIQQYFLSGHMIGNHTHSHLSASKVDQKEFLEDLLKAQNILKERNFLPQYFRYPFLHRGKRPDVIAQNIYAYGLRDGFVTIDTYDWYLDQAIENNGQNFVNLTKLKEAYLAMILESVEFYAAIAKEYVKGECPQILLLHENDLSAEYITDLVAHLKKRGWEIVSPEEAYQDHPLTELPQADVAHHQGRVMAHALANGYKGPIQSKYESKEAVDKLLIYYQVFSPTAQEKIP